MGRRYSIFILKVALQIQEPAASATAEKPVPPPNTVRGPQKVHITELYSVCLRVGIGTPPPLLPLASVPPPPQPKGRGAHLPAGEGWGYPDSDDWIKSLSICLLCGRPLLEYRDFYTT
jgi:hypothetical protein